MLRLASPEQELRQEPESPIDRNRLVARYRRNRERSRLLFDLLTDEDAHYSQPIPLRHPFVFYEGHVPAFSFNTLVKNALGGLGIDPALEGLFARGIDPPTDQATAPDAARNRERWPSRRVVQQFAQAADERVIEALTHGDIDRPGHPLLDRAEAAFVILEHEVMHQETLLYMLHRVPYGQKRSPSGYRPRVDGTLPRTRWIEIGPGRATLGIDRSAATYSWDNERPRHTETVRAFAIESGNVTNAAFMEFVSAGGYREQRFWRPADWEWVRREDLRHPPFWERQESGWTWRGLFQAIPLPPAWPVYVSHAEAEAYARWHGARLPTEAEFQRAAYGVPGGEERRFPWGETTPDAGRHGVFDFSSWDPAPAGSHPDGRSAWGVDDLVGNGWDNEAEIELILKEKFPDLDRSEEWYSEAEAKAEVDRVLGNPERYESLFMKCLRAQVGEDIPEGAAIQISGPETIGGMTVYRLTLGGRELRFDFVSDEPTIEDIVLPGPKSIYDVCGGST